MKHLILFLLLSVSALAQTVSTPLLNGKLTGPLDANAQVIKAANKLGIGIAGTAPTNLLHLNTSGTTPSTNGITIGPGTGDVHVYRGSSGTLNVSGNLAVSGSISGSAGIVQLAGSNTFSGTNVFNGSTTLANVTMSGTFAVSNDAASNIRTAIALVPGANVQIFSAQLAAIAALNPADGNVIMRTGGVWVAEAGATARTSLGLGTLSNVTFANGALTGTLAVTGASTLTGKVTVAGATDDTTGLQFGSAGAFYGSGTGIVTDDPFTTKANVVFGDATSDTVTLAGKLIVIDTTFERTSSDHLTLDATLIADAFEPAAPVGATFGGTGLDVSALSDNKFLYVASGAWAQGTVTPAARTLLDDAAISDIRTTLELGGAALLAVGTTTGTVAAGDDSRLTNSRAPTGTAAGSGSDIEGAYPDSVTIKVNAVELATNTTGSYVASLTAGTGITLGGTNSTENAVPVINIGQSVATGATPTFAGITLSGSGAFTSGTFSGTVTTVNAVVSGALTVEDLTVNGVLDIGSSLSMTTLELDELVLNNSGTPNIGKVSGLQRVNVIHVAADDEYDTNTRTNLTAYDEYRPFTTIAAATTASVAGDVIHIHPAATEYAVPSEFGADGRFFYLSPGAYINGLTVTTDLNFDITGQGGITGNVSVGHAGAVINLTPPVTGTFTVSNGEVTATVITGDVTISGGTLSAQTLTGATAVSSGTLTGETVVGNVTITGGTTTLTDITGALSTTTGTVTVNNVSSTVASVSGTTTVRGNTAAITTTGGAITVQGSTGAVSTTTGTTTINGTVTGTVTSVSGTTVIRGPVVGAVTHTAGTMSLYGPVTGNITAASGTLNIYGPVTGSLTVSGATVNLYNQVMLSSAGTVITLSSGTLNCYEGSGSRASSLTETAVTRSGGTWNVYAPMTLLGVTSGTMTVAAYTIQPTPLKTEVTITADNATTITPASASRILLVSDNATATARTFTLSTTGAVTGQTYVLIGPDTNACELADSSPAMLSAAWEAEANDTLTLLFDGTYFVELSRSNN